MGRRTRECPTPDDLGITEKEWHRLVKFGREIKAAYVSNRRRIKPNFTLDTATWGEKFWFETAQKLDANKVTDALTYVSSQFERTSPLICMPNQLLGHTAFSYYDQRVGPRAQLANAELVVQWNKDIVSGQVRQGRAVRDILVNPPVPLNALFSYCLALSENMSDLAPMFEAGAREFLHAFPHYRQTALGAFIPKELT